MYVAEIKCTTLKKSMLYLTCYELFSFEWQVIFFNISKGEGNPRCVEDFGGTFSEEGGGREPSSLNEY